MGTKGPIKNYTTEVAAEKTVSEIEAILIRHKVNRIAKEYDNDGVSALMFSVATPHGPLPFKLPIHVAAVKKILEGEFKGKRGMERYNTTAQARRIGWRILKDWVDSQLALVQIGMVKMEQVFMPYIFDAGTGATLFQKLEQTKFAGLLAAPELKVYDESLQGGRES